MLGAVPHRSVGMTTRGPTGLAPAATAAGLSDSDSGSGWGSGSGVVIEGMVDGAG
ncbi:hypothetical protein GCM10022255_113530 [Dactylosporangium darangshiense]|uniref:Uncharacterized protein n=1 Tax=Dactylosporangium darangshiense TaxID=579108 RepID=A0ABP8DVI8_9ACTN